MENRLLPISTWVLASLGAKMFIYYQDRIPISTPILVVSNHRSFMDPMLLALALGHPIRFVCHHYMSQVPLLSNLVTAMGAFPLDKPGVRQRDFLQKAITFLQQGEIVGIFPEGAPPMLQSTDPDHVGRFERGFAHLAWRAEVPELVVLPVAIASCSEKLVQSGIPLELLRLFDPSEPLFAQPGFHPLLFYQKVNILIGRPYWINSRKQKQYQGKQAKILVNDLINHCQSEIKTLLDQGCF